MQEKFIANMYKLKILAHRVRLTSGSSCYMSSNFFSLFAINFDNLYEGNQKTTSACIKLKGGKKTQQHGFWEFNCFFLHSNVHIYGVAL
jgi:hypothetical protein